MEGLGLTLSEHVVQRRLNKQLITSRKRLLTLLLASSAVCFTGDRSVAQEVNQTTTDATVPLKPVGVGVLLPSPPAPAFQIAKRPWFWERFTETDTTKTSQIAPPKPPLAANSDQTTPPSAVWTPPQTSENVSSPVVVPKPKNGSNQFASEENTDGAWTQRGVANARNAEPNSTLNSESIVGSGLPAESRSSDSTTGKLEPTTSVIRLLPVNADRQPETAREAVVIDEKTAAETNDSSVVILKAPISNKSESVTPDMASESLGEIASDAEGVDTLDGVHADSESQLAPKIGRKIASSTEDPIPLQDPEDLAAQAEIAETKTFDGEPQGTSSPQMEESNDAIVVEEALAADNPAEENPSEENPSEEAPVTESIAKESTESLQSSRRKVVVRDVRIKRDGSPASEDNSSRQTPSDQERSMPESEASPDSVAKQEKESSVENTPAAIKTIEVGRKVDYTGYPQTSITLSSSVRQIKPAMSQCLKYYYGRPESANIRSNWGMLHAIMVWGSDTPILAGNNQYNAIAWIAGNNHCAGKPLLIQQNGRMVATTGVGLQGHQAQFLAVLALCDVPIDYPLYVGETKYTIDDLVKEEMLACRSGEELTFSLIGLSHYLDTNTRWTNAEGETWDVARLIKEEMSQPIVGSACGGTHRLMGFAHALRKRRIEGREITGQWKRAEIYTDDFVQYVFRLQNRDGSMSTDWFEGREDNGSMDRKIQTTGHMVEWLLSVLPDSQLQDPRLVSAVRYIANAMNRNRTHQWKIGPKGHALRSLAMYYDRVYQEGPAWQSLVIATEEAANRR